MKFELESYNRNKPDTELLTDLKRVAKVIKKDTITKKDYSKRGKFHSSTIERRFGGWLKALEKAGLKKTRNYGISDKEFIDNLTSVANKIGKGTITKNEYENYGKYSVSGFCYRFGTWFKALEAAGLKKTRNLNISKEELFNNLEEIWIKLGRQPRYNEIQKPLSKYSPGTYEYRFGTWRKALEAFVDYINDEETIQMDENNFIEKDKIDSETENDIIETLNHKTKRNINWRLRFIVMRRDNFKCKICGKSPANNIGVELQVDHILSWTKGGETVLDNLQTLCSVCNIGKSDMQMSINES